ncbi:hypothetical protein HKCCE4037_04405 [Rhodobacterales bacterium HKCCE4037]|nr:hypothetical protein [Rhodobacterales bacterium HKCCE4037]
MSSVDWNRLHELQADIGKEDFLDVAMVFVAELEETLSGMTAEAATADDFHFLRGSAANLGFTALVEACSQAEARTKTGALPDVDAVKSAFGQALTEMSAQMPGLTIAA